MKSREFSYIPEKYLNKNSCKKGRVLRSFKMTAWLLFHERFLKMGLKFIESISVFESLANPRNVPGGIPYETGEISPFLSRIYRLDSRGVANLEKTLLNRDSL